jgi:hypothetical protein
MVSGVVYDVVDPVNMLQMKKSLKVTFPEIGNSDRYIIQLQKIGDQFFAHHIAVVIKPPEITGMDMIDDLPVKNGLRYKGN